MRNTSFLTLLLLCVAASSAQASEQTKPVEKEKNITNVSLQELLTDEINKVYRSMKEKELIDPSSQQPIQSLMEYSKLENLDVYKQMMWHNKNITLVLYKINTNGPVPPEGYCLYKHFPFHFASSLKIKYNKTAQNLVEKLCLKTVKHLIKTNNCYQDTQPITYTVFDDGKDAYSGPQELKNKVIKWANKDIQKCGELHTILNKETITFPNASIKIGPDNQLKLYTTENSSVTLDDPEKDTSHQLEQDIQELTHNLTLINISHPVPGITKKDYLPQLTDDEHETNQD